MKLDQKFIPFDNNGEALLVASGAAAFHGLVRGNGVLGDILSLLEEEISEADLIAAMAERYDAPPEVIGRDVKSALAQLREIGALEE